jgi:hypothetical protein
VRFCKSCYRLHIFAPYNLRMCLCVRFCKSCYRLHIFAPYNLRMCLCVRFCGDFYRLHVFMYLHLTYERLAICNAGMSCDCFIFVGSCYPFVYCIVHVCDIHTDQKALNSICNVFQFRFHIILTKWFQNMLFMLFFSD